MLGASLLAYATHAQTMHGYRVMGPSNTTLVGWAGPGLLSWSNVASAGMCTVQQSAQLWSPSGWLDCAQTPATGTITTLLIQDQSPPPGMVLIPAGYFQMGDALAEGATNERPVHLVNVSACYMDTKLVTKPQWDEVYAWALTNGYDFEYSGSNKAPDHPVCNVNWFDCVKWCNARSEKAGLVPCYYTNAEKTVVYRSDRAILAESWVAWSATGYRLPTEAEWEKAARGGPAGLRFPWPDSDRISRARANYSSYWEEGAPFYDYDDARTEGADPAYATGNLPYTSPVGSFTANPFGLYDMAGNLHQWCWDWYGEYWYTNAAASQMDTRGPATGPGRVIRGGYYLCYPVVLRCASRSYFSARYASLYRGFRCVRAAQPL